MAIPAGTRLGPYEVLSAIGAGGMGEVYRARDSHLNREVALKVLPEAFARDSERMARFEREAKLLASLNHPNIASIYGLEISGQTRALVMELVEGPTLAERIATGSIPVNEALPIAKQIAEAVEYAHEQNVIHRDLKPANIKVKEDGTVKVLDFGLAKAMSDEIAVSDMSNSPTLSMAATRAGIILGTAAYMSPEQARGKSVDRRTDVWAFGCVLYEMLTGKQAFQGEDVTEILAAVVMKEPAFDALPAKTPAPIRNLLRRCLEKNLRQRLQHIGEARILLENINSGATRAEPAAVVDPSKTLQRMAWVAAAVLMISTVALGFWVTVLKRPPAEPQAVRFSVGPPGTGSFFTGPNFLTVSPDGNKLAFIASDAPSKPLQLWIRSLDSETAQALPGTDGATQPFWSPDSRFLAFYADGKLKKIGASGGPPQTLTDAPSGGDHGTWNRDGVILFAPAGVSPRLIYRVSAAGGKATPITTLDVSRHENYDAWPYFLPDGYHFLYMAHSTNPENTAVFTGSLVSPQKKLLLNVLSNVIYVPPGYLLFNREGTLMAQSFDAQRLELTGDEVPIAENMDFNPTTGRTAFSASENGVLAYRAGGASQARLVWVDRKGASELIPAPARPYAYPRLSPDGEKVAVSQAVDIWVYDIPRGTLTRLTFDGRNGRSVWTPDGKRITFASDRENSAQNIYWTAADGSGGTERLTSSSYLQVPEGWAPDGRTLAFSENRPTTGWDIWMLPFPDRKPRLFLQTPFHDGARAFSPDGHWLAYYSDESGRGEVYARPYPGPGGKLQISTEGGAEPVWSRSGREFFYRNGNKFLAMDIELTPTLVVGKPKVLFEGPYLTALPANFDVSPDRQHFLMLKADEQTQAAPTQISVVLNWTEELKRRVPTGNK